MTRVSEKAIWRGGLERGFEGITSNFEVRERLRKGKQAEVGEEEDLSLKKTEKGTRRSEKIRTKEKWGVPSIKSEGGGTF